MVRYLNPGGFNFGGRNLDGYGISQIVVGVSYSLFFYASCIFLWLYRHHPMVRKRNVPLLLLSLLTLHVFNFMVLVVYTLNGAFPCQVEFWCMSLYLPIGIGLFQAQNQQLLVVSEGQSQLLHMEEPFRRLPPKRIGLGSPRYWRYRFKLWWEAVGKAGRYQAYVFVGIIVQFTVSMVVYNISRKFNHYGIVSKHVGPGLCRRGWEWAPSIIWQFLWNYFFGPYLIWKVRMVRDIYHWRLQTILAVVAGLPGTPIWLASVYTGSFGVMNKYWIPAMWFVPGLTTMEIVTLGFPIYQIFRYKQAARETHRALEEFDKKRQQFSDDSTTTESLDTSNKTHQSLPSTIISKRGGMHPMESLDECLSTNPDNLQMYSSCMELNGENIIFLTRVLAFQRSCTKAFQSTCNNTTDFRRARTCMFRIALSIFVSLVHARTATYPINIESIIYTRLDAIFGPATTLVARERYFRSTSISTGNSSSVTPWDEPHGERDEHGNESYPMHAIGGDTAPQHPQPTFSRKGSRNESRERIVQITAVVNEDGSAAGANGADPLEGVKVPADFDETVFDAAFKSVRYMVWTETWQRYMSWKGKLGGAEPRISVNEIHV